MAKHKSNDDSLNGLTPDIMERYLHGTLSEEMRQKVEQYLEENPFEAEALEGIKSYSVDLNRELDQLSQQLSHKIPSKATKPSRYFWPAAAVVSLVVISGLIIYLLLPGQQEITPIAINKETTVPQPEDLTQTTTRDTPQLEQSTPDASDTASQPENGTLETRNETTAVNTGPEQVPETTRQAVEPTPNEPARQELQELIVADTEEPATNLAVSDEQQVLEETINLDVELEEAPAIDQNIAFNNTTRSRKSTPGIAASRAVPQQEEIIEFPTAQPPVDWSDYLSRQLRYPDAARANGIEGTVKIRFQVDANGKPGNFELVEKLGYGCDQEALRVLQNSPLWIPGSQNNITVPSMAEIEIKFPANDP